MKTTSLLAALILSLSGCATFPQTPEAEASFYVDAAKSSVSKGEGYAAATNADVALTKPTGGQKVRDMVAEYPKIREYYRSAKEKEIAEMSLVYQPIAIHERLLLAKSAGLFSENDMNDLMAKLKKAVSDANLSGSIPFDLSDNLGLFPDLQTPEHQAIMRDRTIKNLQLEIGFRRIVPLVTYIQKVGSTSDEGKRIESLLPSMNIKRDEIDIVAKVYPAFAAARKEAITRRVLLKVKNGDRLFADDIQQALRSQLRGIDWVTEIGPKVTILGIERVRNDERTLPERTQTITYSQGQVNFLSGALLMPRNASYLYEVISGGAEIEYGYVVDAISEGKTIYEKVIRGKVGGEYQRCQNERIQNVFGGVNPATFVANDDQKQRCSGPSATSLDQLRNEVLSKVVEGVREMPAIKAAEELK
ncbi:MAG: hypothetical protein K8H84_03200 [Sulfuricella denitrificans]|nr:hypothetical protein [Sulfuricella denitrificans]